MGNRPPVSGLSDHLGYWLRLVSNRVSITFARKLDAEGVTVAEWVVLRMLFDVDDRAPSELATTLGMTRSAISKLADRLLAKGLIDRIDDHADGRAHSLRLSDKARRLVPRLAAVADVNDQSFFGVLKADERAALRRLLEKLVEQHGLTETPVT